MAGAYSFLILRGVGLKRLFLSLLFLPSVVVGQVSCDETCTFVLKSSHDRALSVSNEARAKQRFSPFSTFKIPNSLIAIDSGLVTSSEQKLSFDRTKYPVEGWWRKSWYEKPLNLKEAFSVSAVPIYRQLAHDLGEAKMSERVKAFAYGNQDISSGVDNFWLSGSIQISANEQIAFLQRLNEGKLPVSERSLEAFKDVMRVEMGEGYALYAKTGAGRLNPQKVLGWYVGFVEKQNETF